MTHRMCFLRRAATSSLVVVCGFNCGHIFPAGVLAGRGAAIHVAFLDFEEGLLAQLGQKFADLRLHLGRVRRSWMFVLHFFERRLPRFEALFDLENQEALRTRLNRIGDDSPSSP